VTATGRGATVSAIRPVEDDVVGAMLDRQRLKASPADRTDDEG